MKINLTTQTLILTIKDDDDLLDGGHLYEMFNKELDEQLENNQDITNIKTLAYNENEEGSGKLVLLIFDKENGFTQKEIISGNA